jgi:antitoxin VapB
VIYIKLGGDSYGDCKDIFFENGRSQAVRLPKKFRFNTDEVIVQQLGDAVILVPMESMWQTFMDGLNSFTDDIFEDGRDQGIQQERENL